MPTIKEAFDIINKLSYAELEILKTIPYMADENR